MYFLNALFVWCLIIMLFMIIHLKSHTLILTILNVEFFSVILVFNIMLSSNYNSNILLYVLIVLIYFSMESVILLTFYVSIVRFNSKDYSVI